MARVLLDARVGIGGVGRYYSVLAAALAHDPELEVFAVAPTESGWARPFTPWGRAQVARTARSLGVDVVHGLHLELPRFNGPVVVTIHDLIPLEHPASMRSALRRAIFRRILARTLERAGRVIAPSAQTADALIAHGAPGANIVTVPNAVADSFSPCTEEERAAARDRFAGGQPYVAAVSGTKAHKNLAVVEAVARSLASDSLPVVCVGVTGDVPSVTTMANFIDSDLRLFYAGAEVTLFPSLIEGFGFPVVESLACGTPVVCGANIGALAHAHEGVIVVDVGQPHEVVAAIRKVATDPGLRAGLAGNGRSAVAALTPERMAAETKAVYEEVL